MSITIGAGIIIVRKFNNDIKFLGLIGPKHLRKKHSGIYDIPKGCVDAGETFYDCAIRECKEETNYSFNDYSIITGPWSNNKKTLYLWLAETCIDPILNINPSINMPEHSGYDWLDYETLSNNCYNYLKDGLMWGNRSLKKFGKF